MGELGFLKDLSLDHDEVLGKLKELEEPLKTPDPVRVGEILALLKARFAVHFKAEEEILFPRLNAQIFEEAMEKMGGPIRPVGGPVKVLLAEHKVLLELVEEVKRHLVAGRWKELKGAGEQFILLLRSHIFREENIVFKLAETSLPPNIKEEIAERIAAAEKLLGA